jgi:hypothetical protein
MKIYIYLNNLGEVREFIDEFNPAFPNIPIEDRYSPEFLDSCLIMEESEFEQRHIVLGTYYDKETDSFYIPEIEVIEEEEKEEIISPSTEQEAIIKDGEE